jgi:hypothetical protein
MHSTPDLKAPAVTPSLSHGHRAGLFASWACAVHCALTPFAVSLFPLAGAQTWLDHRLEWLLVALAIVLGAATIVPAYNRHHHRRSPLIWFAAGSALMLGARLLVPHGAAAELPLSLAGAAALITAQVLNARYRHICPCDHSTHGHGQGKAEATEVVGT